MKLPCVLKILSRRSGQHATGVQSMASYFQQGANLKNQNAKKPTTIPVTIETCSSADLLPQLMTHMTMFSMVDAGETWTIQTC